MKSSFLHLLLTVLLGHALGATGAEAPARLRVSDNHRFLVCEDGRPFFYLGDTAWELFHRLNREESARYLKDRADKAFTVIQAVALAELDGTSVPNAYGHLPLVELDPARPAVKDGPNNDYWDHVDYIATQANALGLTIGFLPTWGRYWHDGQPLFTAANAEAYGNWLGRRYKDARLIWILGGDRKVESEPQKDVIRAMARGLRNGDGGAHLITFHPCGGGGSADVFHGEDWLDFNFVATRDSAGSYAMVYAPVGRPFKVHMDTITGGTVKAWWFNPRDGSAKAIGEFPNTGERAFAPPDSGEMLDWVLVLDDAAKNLPAPGRGN